MTGLVYPIVAIAAGLALLYFGIRLGRERTLSSAAVLLASVFYLPALLAVMVLHSAHFLSMKANFRSYAWAVLIFHLAVVVWGGFCLRIGLWGGLRRTLASLQRTGRSESTAPRHPDRVRSSRDQRHRIRIRVGAFHLGMVCV